MGALGGVLGGLGGFLGGSCGGLGGSWGALGPQIADRSVVCQLLRPKELTDAFSVSFWGASGHHLEPELLLFGVRLHLFDPFGILV